MAGLFSPTLGSEAILTFFNWLQNSLFAPYFSFFLLRSAAMQSKKIKIRNKYP
jgi:hypothetical protein